MGKQAPRVLTLFGKHEIHRFEPSDLDWEAAGIHFRVDDQAGFETSGGMVGRLADRPPPNERLPYRLTNPQKLRRHPGSSGTDLATAASAIGAATR